MPKAGDKHFAYTKAGEKAAKTHAAKTGKKVEHSGPYMKKSGFKMKGSPFQRNFGIGSPMKEETTRIGYTGADIDPARSYEYKGAKIPSFRDMVSLEQQQAYAKKVDERRAKRKEGKKKSEDVGLDKQKTKTRLDPGVDFTKSSVEKFDPLAEELAEEKIKYGETDDITSKKLNLTMPSKYEKPTTNIRGNLS